jgi:hypothetical protein
MLKLLGDLETKKYIKIAITTLFFWVEIIAQV